MKPNDEILKEFDRLFTQSGHTPSSPDGAEEYHYDWTDSPDEVRKFIQQALEAKDKEIERQRNKFKNVVAWLLGYRNFPIRQLAEGQYYWRSYLRIKLVDEGFSDILESLKQKDTQNDIETNT